MAVIPSKPNTKLVWASQGYKAEPLPDKQLEGWVQEIPPHEVANWIEYKQDLAIKYLYQEGIPEWDSSFEYNTNSYVKYNNEIYRLKAGAEVPNIGKQPDVSSNNSWETPYVTNVDIDNAIANKADKSTTFTAGNGLTGGGNLSANRTISLGSPSSITANSTNSVNNDSHTHALADNSVTTNKIAKDAVTTNKIEDDAVTNVKIKSVAGEKINSGTIPAARLPLASATVAGATRIYTSTGTSTDGTMTRAAITSAIASAGSTLGAWSAFGAGTVYTNTSGRTQIIFGRIARGNASGGSGFVGIRVWDGSSSIPPAYATDVTTNPTIGDYTAFYTYIGSHQVETFSFVVPAGWHYLREQNGLFAGRRRVVTL